MAMFTVFNLKPRKATFLAMYTRALSLLRNHTFGVPSIRVVYASVRFNPIKEFVERLPNLEVVSEVIYDFELKLKKSELEKKIFVLLKQRFENRGIKLQKWEPTRKFDFSIMSYGVTLSIKIDKMTESWREFITFLVNDIDSKPTGKSLELEWNNFLWKAAIEDIQIKEKNRIRVANTVDWGGRHLYSNALVEFSKDNPEDVIVEYNITKIQKDCGFLKERWILDQDFIDKSLATKNKWLFKRNLREVKRELAKNKELATFIHELTNYTKNLTKDDVIIPGAKITNREFYNVFANRGGAVSFVDTIKKKMEAHELDFEYSKNHSEPLEGFFYFVRKIPCGYAYILFEKDTKTRVGYDIIILISSLKMPYGPYSYGISVVELLIYDWKATYWWQYIDQQTFEDSIDYVCRILKIVLPIFLGAMCPMLEKMKILKSK